MPDIRPSAFQSTVVVTAGDRSVPIGGVPIWSIAEVLAFDDDGQWDFAVAAHADDPRPPAEFVEDLIASRLIAAPRPRRRRERSVSSRAVFHRAAPDRGEDRASACQTATEEVLS